MSTTTFVSTTFRSAGVVLCIGFSMAIGCGSGERAIALSPSKQEQSALASLLPQAASWPSSDGQAANSIAFGDVDGDGNLDLVIGCRNGRSNRLYVNSGGTLEAAASWVSAEADDTSSVAFGDIDGDGDLDLMAGNTGAQGDRGYINGGDTLQAVASWTSGDAVSTSDVAFGDVDGDGDLDLAAAGAKALAAGSSRVHSNTGVSLEGQATWLSTETDPAQSVAFADVDSDGDLDFAVGRGGGRVNLLYDNAGMGLVQTASWVSAEAEDTRATAFGDIDGDGDLDLAVGNGADSSLGLEQPSRIYANTGLGLSAAAVWTSYDTDYTFDIALGDVDGDGDLELATANWSYQNDRLHYNGGTGIEVRASWSSAETGRSTSIAFGDLTGDGSLALAVGNDVFGYGLYLGPSARFETDAIWSSTDSRQSYSVALGDVDGDGDLDVAVGNYSQPNRLYENTGAGLGAIIWTSTENERTESIAFGDVDGDGDLELADVCDIENERIYTNTGAGLETTATWLSTERGRAHSVAFGDIDSDGALDMAVGTKYANLLYFNTGSGLAPTAQWFSSASDDTFGVALGDVEGDGDLDLVAGNYVDPDRLYVNTGASLGVASVWSTALPVATRCIAFGDVDGDGDLDLGTGTASRGTLLYANMGSALATTSMWSSTATPYSNSVAWGDADGDGDLDLAVGNGPQHNYIYNNAAAGFEKLASWESTESDETKGVAFGDLDQDGDLELAAANAKSQVNRLYARAGTAAYGLPSGTGGQYPAGLIGNVDGVAIAPTIHSSVIQTGSPLTIPFTLFDAQSNTISRVELQYSYGGGKWNAGTLLGATTNFASGPGPTGVAHSLTWDLATDEVYGNDVRIRLRLIGERRTSIPFPWHRASVTIDSTSYAIGADPGPDQDGDGIRGFLDCDDTSPDCTSDCSDADADTIPDCKDSCIDVDGDGYGDPGSASCPMGASTDCNDGSAAINPGASDTICDGLDDDCDGPIDEDYVAIDACGSGYCLQNSTPSSCLAGVEVLCLPASPIESSEVTCTDLIDNDCDGFVDGADPECVGESCVDVDGDGYGNPGSSACGKGPAWDCNDSDASIKPGADDSVCNGIDDDCDSIVDGGYAVDYTCGIGYCRAANIPSSCVAGVETACQEALPLNLIDSTCNNIDDDCDGFVDNDYVIDDGCGVGFCNDTNVASKCSAGIETLCQAGTQFAATDSTCDAIDDDCDGYADEEYMSDASCGVGDCLLGNRPSTCIDGVEALCRAGVPAELAEQSCGDGRDNDCDGASDNIDADCVCIDADGDGYDTCSPATSTDTDGLAKDCDDSANVVNPGRAENKNPTCTDGIDNDCDGATDCSDVDCSIPACSACPADGDGDGYLACGSTPDCDDVLSTVHPGQADGTCDGVDDDCDALMDEDYARDSACGVGVCLTTAEASSCSGGIETPCAPGLAPEVNEVSCGDGLDNDCDGLSDDADSDCIPTCTDLDGDGYGSPGDPTCPGGAALDCDDTQASIRPGVLDTTCDAIDDNCDGTADEDYMWDDTCGVGICYVLNSVSTCIAGVETACIPGAAQETPETSCGDGVDNDCDGATDGSDVDCGGSCLDGDGDGYGNPGDATCRNGAATDCNDVDASINPGVEDTTCDGVDDDCDGTADENYMVNASCGVGYCKSSNTPSSCAAGFETVCIPGAAQETPETNCGDGIDNDCDGATDGSDGDCAGSCLDGDGDGYGNPGHATCPNGAVTDCNDADASIKPGVGDIICDGVDDDCDGAVDEDYVVDSSCGVGWCNGNNIASSCVAGVEVECTAASPLTTTDTSCDAVDDDCDGVADDDYLSDVSCGVGHCQSSNIPSSCSNGVEQGCEPAIPTEIPEQSCLDGVDNDCDGFADSADSDCAGTCVDVDGDGICDSNDNCVNSANQDQLNTDSDTQGNVCDADDDNDGILDAADSCPLVANSGPLTVPIAYAGPDLQMDELTLVSLDGVDSCFVSGPKAYSWRQVSGPAISASDFAGGKLTFLAPRVYQDEELVIELVVSDDRGVSTAVTVRVLVRNTINEAPTAEAGADQMVYAGDLVILDGGGSADANGDALVYLWRQVAGFSITLTDEASLNPTFVAPTVTASQNMVLELLVRDVHGAMALDALVITVMPTSGAPVFVSAPALVAMVGEAYSYDADNTLEVGGERPLTYSVSLAEGDFMVDSDGFVGWTPQNEGLHEIAMVARNKLGSAEQRFWVSVFASPVIVSTPNESFLLGTPYRYDADGLPEALGSSPIVWSLQTGPTGMGMGATTGELFWIPTDASPVSVTIAATNAHGEATQSFFINRDGPTSPYIGPTGNILATIHQPYPYDADKHVDVVGILPGERLRVQLLTGPTDYIVHPTTREVGWLPTVLGSYDVSLALVTGDEVIIDQYDYTVDVGSDGTVLLQAVADVAPKDGTAPLSVVLDGSRSTGTDGLPILQYVWDTQSGPILRSTAALSSHEYNRPGGYTVSLQIWDTLGYIARDKVGVAVLDGIYWPPSASIIADHVEGEGTLTVNFGCDCVDPDGEVLSTVWQFGDGAISSELAPEHTFERPGSYSVHLTIEDDQGLLAYDSVTVTVRSEDKSPPYARIETSSFDGNGPLVLELHADTEDRDGVVEYLEWTLPDGAVTSSENITISIPPGDYYKIQLRAVDNDGLSGFDERTIIVRKDEERPPRIVSEPARLATVGVPYVYDADGLPSVQGDRPMLWSLGRSVDGALLNVPEGMTVVPQTGVFQWEPKPGQEGQHRITLGVSNSVGNDVQDFVVTVRATVPSGIGDGADGGRQAAVSSGCACRGSRTQSGGSWVVLAGLLLALRRRAIRS